MEATTRGRTMWQRTARRCTTSLGAFGVTAAVALGSCGPVATQCAPAAAPAPVAPAGVAEQVVALTNAERARVGLPALALEGLLSSAAQAHSADQAAANTMSHTGTDGSDPGARIARVGYSFSAWGENVAAGYGDAASVMSGWMNSPGHRANILEANYTQIGIGLAYSANGTPYWTMDLGRPR